MRFGFKIYLDLFIKYHLFVLYNCFFFLTSAHQMLLELQMYFIRFFCIVIMYCYEQGETVFINTNL